MGGHAFKNLHCPRMPPNVYAKAKSTATAALHEVFTHVTVPFEVPGKADHGDCDFLVAAPFGDPGELTLDTFPFALALDATKHALNTPHGRRGFLTPTCMYFAIPMPSDPVSACLDHSDNSDGELQSWVQIDVKICFKPDTFGWTTFELNHASQCSILGNMIKPLGLTLDNEGLHVRVAEMESTDWAGSMVWITRDPWTACRVLGLSRKPVDGGYTSAEEIYEEYAGSWLFHPEQFEAKLEDESYLVQHAHRSYFLKKWIPERYPGYSITKDESGQEGLRAWTACTRVAVREKAFTMFPHIAEGYYTRRSQHVNEVEERRLRDLITAAIPTGTDGWRDDFHLPNVIIRHPVTQEASSTTLLQLATAMHEELTPPPSPPSKPADLATAAPSTAIALPYPPLYIDALSREPPLSYKPAPPPHTMSTAARLSCLARWTAFSTTGIPYLRTFPHAKDFDLQWRDAMVAGCRENELIQWAADMWWVVWVRQCVVNWRGMWAKRFEKEDKKAEKVRNVELERIERDKVEQEARVKAEETERLRRELVSRRLEGLNRALGLRGGKE